MMAFLLENGFGTFSKYYKISQLIHTQKCCELVGFFVSLDIPPQIRFGNQNGGNTLGIVAKYFESLQLIDC